MKVYLALYLTLTFFYSCTHNVMERKIASGPEQMILQIDTWVGNFQTQVTRATTKACDVNAPDSFSHDSTKTIILDSWSYQRASVAALCVEVYMPNVTDAGLSDRVTMSAVLSSVTDRTVQAEWVRQVGNNVVFAIPLKNLDVLYNPIYNRTLIEEVKEFHINFLGTTQRVSNIPAITVHHKP